MEMYELIKDFSNNLTQGLTISETAIYKKPLQKISNVVIVGMGGSGIGGLLVSQWLYSTLSVPVTLVKDYELPGFVSEHTLVIGSSYSGNTEETLIALQEAKRRKSFIIGICSGGKLLDFCNENYYDCTVVPGGNPPRTALAFSIIQLLNIFTQLGLAEIDWKNPIRDAKELIDRDKELIHVEAKKLAGFLNTCIPVFYSSPHYEGVAIRARQQFNENSKVLCWHHVIPEMNHNELVGWGGGSDTFGVVVFDSGDWGERNNIRREFTLEVLSTKTDKIYLLKTKGKNIIEKSLYFINIVDWASWYLSEAKKVDPIEINVINNLKNTLSSI
ncbi:MAG: bifunctional phosphoglucose/phosphomannose isomerase [Flavobacteriia bacterium]|nr:bifunctional phosphoglucose/phosphomannose isomerase [Flavobacteriia bacterium]